MEKFQHTAARRRLEPKNGSMTISTMFQHTAARRRLGKSDSITQWRNSFNTQPPEGGWATPSQPPAPRCGFNTQPPEGGWVFKFAPFDFDKVSTHSRPKAAGSEPSKQGRRPVVSTHSRPKAAGCRNRRREVSFRVSTHSRPKAAGHETFEISADDWFQHTAARRRLEFNHQLNASP